jgi:uracil-DNA glycosylase
MADVQIEESWKKVLSNEFNSAYFDNIRKVLYEAKAQNTVIYPPGKLIFNAFNSTPFREVKVVIIGQDPYHNPGQAMGLSFSVPKGVRVPPSLKNIFKEIADDIGCTIPDHGDLSSWAAQGVFLLNAMLTVEHNKPSSHNKIGWQTFTDRVIQVLSEERSNLVFLLWGRFAQNKAKLIDETKHLVLQSNHPSPLAGKSFFGNHYFSKTNEYLIRHHIKPIAWEII